MTRDVAFTIRYFRQEDLETIFQIISANIDTCFSRYHNDDVLDYYHQYHSREAIIENNRKGITLVAEIDRKVTGTGTLLGDYISTMFIHPDYQCLGVGALLLDHLEQLAAGQGISVVHLDATPGSRKYYEKKGYLHRGIRYMPVGNQRRLYYYPMTKQLL